MKISECVEKMTKQNLNRLLKAVLKDGIPKNESEEKLKELAIAHTTTLANDERISKELEICQFKRSERILSNELLTHLLEGDDARMNVNELWGKIKSYEEMIKEKAEKKYIEKVVGTENYNIFKTVLSVALEDDEISIDEFRIIKKLREKLHINQYHSRIIEAELKNYPKKNNELHGINDFNNILKLLEEKGILFYFKENNGHFVAIPSEIEDCVRKTIGFELGINAHAKMLEKLNKEQLERILNELHLQKSGRKDEMTERIIEAGFKPSEELEILSNEEITDLCRDLPGVKVSGKMQEKIQRIISFFNNLETKIFTPIDTDDEREIYYKFFVELAKRDSVSLKQHEVIKSDAEIGIGFEKGTKYIFEKKFVHTVIYEKNKRKADGCVEIPGKGLLLWDNKSKNNAYEFNTSNQRQFQEYIDEAKGKVSIFLVIVPEVKDQDKANIEQVAQILKNKNKYETDVCVIQAYDLKAIAEEWRNVCGSEKFPLEVFNFTGIATKEKIISYLKSYRAN